MNHVYRITISRMLRLLVTCAPWALTQSWGLRGTSRSLRSQQKKDLPASVLLAIQEYTEACKSPKATPTCVPFGISNQAREVLPATLPASAMSGSRRTGKPEALNLQSKNGQCIYPELDFLVFVVSGNSTKENTTGYTYKKGR